MGVKRWPDGPFSTLSLTLSRRRERELRTASEAGRRPGPPYSGLSGSSFGLSDSDQASVVQIEAASHGIDARQSAVQLHFPSHS